MVYRITTPKRGTVAKMPPNRTTGILCRTIDIDAMLTHSAADERQAAYHAGQLTKEGKRANGNHAHKTTWHVTIGGTAKPMSGYNPDVINEEKRRYGIPHNYQKKGNGGKDTTEQNNRHIMPDN